ncbi:peptide deformylase [Methylocapsa palsarum]|uniref:peptide deformylase n=1 Tax=Methylocapsa palsarum TaxID=1612308 RepID=UPI000B82598B|nr:peptide deformylase [Methylocapsa palsarum]
MAIRPIIGFPDPRLRTIAQTVTSFDAELQALAADLIDTMRAAPGIGITAPHIGVGKRLVAIELPASNVVRIYVNPRIIWASEGTILSPEGSVSMPGVLEEIERPARVKVAYSDLSGAERIEEAESLLAVCHQHEIDQLDGIFWILRLSRLKRDRLIRRYEKLRRGNGWPPKPAARG